MRQVRKVKGPQGEAKFTAFQEFACELRPAVLRQLVRADIFIRDVRHGLNGLAGDEDRLPPFLPDTIKKKRERANHGGDEDKKEKLQGGNPGGAELVAGTGRGWGSKELSQEVLQPIDYRARAF